MAELEVVRRRLARPLTLSEKILFGHLDDPDLVQQGLGLLLVEGTRLDVRVVEGSAGRLIGERLKKESAEPAAEKPARSAAPLNGTKTA